MKTPVALTCFVVVFLAVCQASRPETSRMLLAAGDVKPAGTVCADGEFCSDGVTTTRACPASLKCPMISAGLPCLAKDACSTGNADTLTSIVCPADPDTSTKSGVCPVITAGSTCLAKDKCATDATRTSVCPTSKASPDTAICPDFLSGVSCSAITGDCYGDEVCNAPVPVKDVNVPTQNLINSQDATKGVCVIPKQAGSACAAGNLCSGANSYAATYCSASPCPLARPGQSCSPTNPTDKCYDGVNDAGSNCPSETDNNNGITRGVCAPLASTIACVVGDTCETGFVCTASGSTAGTCSAVTIRAGLDCNQAITGTSAAPRDVCPQTTFDMFKDDMQSGVLCPLPVNGAAKGKCPFKTAGYTCAATDLCSDGTSGGTTCDVTTDPTNPTCPALGGNANCYENDKCAPGQFCTGKGQTIGKCTSMVPAGAICAATDFCAPTGSLCPSSLKCPLISAGATCTAAYTESGASATKISAKTGDLCSSGTDAGKACPVANNAGSGATGRCPVLDTGLKCGINDVCVKGAVCLNGVCQPNSKVVVASAGTTPTTPNSPATTASTEYSTEAKVPAVTASPVLTNYDVANFTGTVPIQYCSTIQANILATYSVVSNCSTGTPKAGSVVVPTTVFFSGANSADATRAQSQFVTALKSQDTSVFGNAYGTVTVPASSVQTADVANPNQGSGAAAIGMAWTVGAAIMISALVLTV